MIPVWHKNKYSQLERERKFLLHSLPRDSLPEQFRLIEDKYFPDTRMRLRKISRAGEILELKLSQKFADPNHHGEVRVMTNVYLSEKEFLLFDQLPGQLLKKRRYSYSFQAQQYALDVFEGCLSTLILAEIEFGDADIPHALPAFASKDVTDDSFFSGGYLATLSREAFLHTFQKYEQS